MKCLDCGYNISEQEIGEHEGHKVIGGFFEEKKVKKPETLEQIMAYIEEFVFYVDGWGYIALKPNATENWQAIQSQLEEVKDEQD